MGQGLAFDNSAPPSCFFLVGVHTGSGIGGGNSGGNPGLGFNGVITVGGCGPCGKVASGNGTWMALPLITMGASNASKGGSVGEIASTATGEI